MSDWRTSLRTLRRRFAAASSRHPGLRHVLSIAADAAKDALSEHPFGASDTHPMCIAQRGRLHPIRWGTPCGTARAPHAVVAAAAGTRSTLTPGYVFADGFFGCDDDLDRTKAALAAFDNLAAPAWRVLPRQVRQRLVVDPYLDAAAAADERQSWVLSLYSLAWAAGPESALRADRHVYPRRNSGGHVDLNMEYLFRLPDPVHSVDPGASEPVRKAFPPRPRGEVVAELRERVKRGLHGEVGDLEFPPSRFVAFLEPDLFLASAFAIDAILALAGEPEKVPRPQSRTPKRSYRAPKEPTRRVSLAQAARWFNMDFRTLQRAMAAREIAARQFSPRLWAFDLGDINDHNPKALANADPERHVARPKRKGKKKR